MSVNAEEEIDIWNKEKKNKSETNISVEKKNENQINSSIFQKNKNTTNIKIENDIIENSKEVKIYGIYDPAKNDFNLNMWSQTNAEDVRSSVQRINKMNLSSTSEKLFENTFLSYAYPPTGMSDKEFIDLKINWMIENKRSDLIEEFLKQNIFFHNKKKAIQYLVDENITKANIKESCEKINFIDKNINDSYLEKFKIYCLVFNDKKNEAQLLYDILKEQGQSEKFFDDKINFLLGITDKTSSKVMENNLLNFYLSSITIDNFKFEPKKNTKKEIWEYLNAANLIRFENIEDKEKLNNLEIAANQDQFEKQKILDIYKKIPFDLNTLINAEDLYQTLNGSDSRALVYQKFLLSDNIENKIKLLFLLEELFKKDNFSNIYKTFMSNSLKEINLEEIPEEYQEAVMNKIIQDENIKLGKIKYDDKILHRSRIMKYFVEKTDKKKTEKDFKKIYKKISKNKKYFFSAKDLALIESLINEGFEMPKELKYQEMSKKYNVPSNLLKLANNNEPAFLTLKIVEIIGEDEPQNLDPETIYFILNLLNQINLKKIRNDILISALPLRS
ncbi:hypothetical protein OAA95_01245 [Pelagibacteraceae bacterium]|nr:hypothetical protein [Pelagibacteraceae bacterium]